MTFQAVPFDLRALVADVTRAFQPNVARRPQVKLIADVGDQHVSRLVVGDPQRIRQILANLVCRALPLFAPSFAAVPPLYPLSTLLTCVLRCSVCCVDR
jgi:hypothetical protein